jgi:NAD(P)-dependent dehydrogenase (short-subunit alcohol dehydrogenase family)
LRDEGLSGFDVHQLDVTDEQSVKHAVDSIKEKFPNGVDVLINNAGIGSKTESPAPANANKNEKDAARARLILDTNYFGLKKVTHTFLPLLARRVRVVNVASTLGAFALDVMSEELRKRFMDDKATENDIDQLVNEYLKAVEDNQTPAKGWPSALVGSIDYTPYAVSIIETVA